MTTDINWRIALAGAALLGGIGWGLFAAATVGAAGDQAHLDAVLGPRLLTAAIVSLASVLLAVAAVALSRRAAARRASALRGAGVALFMAPIGGWVIVALQALQAGVR